MKRLDHLIVATPDLTATVEEFTTRFGVRPAEGGSHPGRGTRNALLALGPDTYLEILGPDPTQPPPARPRWAGLDGLPATRLATWIVKSEDLERDLEHARLAGEELGGVMTGARRRADGVELRWRMAGADAPRMDGILPFLIDWGTSPHPAATSPGGVRLISLKGEHPDAARARVVLEALGLDLLVADGPAPKLVARLATPRGEIELS
jgi:Glyoxalase-like domain